MGRNGALDVSAVVLIASRIATAISITVTVIPLAFPRAIAVTALAAPVTVFPIASAVAVFTATISVLATASAIAVFTATISVPATAPTVAVTALPAAIAVTVPAFIAGVVSFRS